MIELKFEADIRCPAPWIFDTIIDFGGQDRWLGRTLKAHAGAEAAGSPP